MKFSFLLIFYLIFSIDTSLNDKRKQFVILITQNNLIKNLVGVDNLKHY